MHPNLTLSRILAACAAVALITAAGTALGGPSDPVLEPSSTARFEFARDRLLVRLHSAASMIRPSGVALTWAKTPMPR